MKRLYNKWKKSGNNKYFSNYKLAKNKYKKEIFQSRFNYENKLLLKSNSKYLYKFMNHQLRPKQKVFKIEDSNGNVTENFKRNL